MSRAVHVVGRVERAVGECEVFGETGPATDFIAHVAEGGVWVGVSAGIADILPVGVVRLGVLVGHNRLQ